MNLIFVALLCFAAMETGRGDGHLNPPECVCVPNALVFEMQEQLKQHLMRIEALEGKDHGDHEDHEDHEDKEDHTSHHGQHTSCKDIQNSDMNKGNGVYTIYPHASDEMMYVACDMSSSGGGWMIIQRRENGRENFQRRYREYVNGFGNMESEFWFGLENIHSMTESGDYELRIDLMDFQGNRRYAHYSDFMVDDANSGYMLKVGGYKGNAGDSFSTHSGKRFSTWDMDRDEWRSGNCARDYKGGWWYGSCHHSNLNGVWGTMNYGEGTNWRYWPMRNWNGYRRSMKEVEMKIRKKM